MKYKTKPVEIEAFPWRGDVQTLFKWIRQVITSNETSIEYIESSDDNEGKLYINTLEGKMNVSLGDFIIKGIKGEFYPCKPDVFKMKYELIRD